MVSQMNKLITWEDAVKTEIAFCCRDTGNVWARIKKKKRQHILIGRFRDCQIAGKKIINAENKSLLHGSEKKQVMGLGRRDRLKGRLRVIFFFFFKECWSIKCFNIYLPGSGGRQLQEMKQQIFIECRCRSLLTIQRSGVRRVVCETQAQDPAADSWLHCSHEPSHSSLCVLKCFLNYAKQFLPRKM